MTGLLFCFVRQLYKTLEFYVHRQFRGVPVVASHPGAPGHSARCWWAWRHARKFDTMPSMFRGSWVQLTTATCDVPKTCRWSMEFMRNWRNRLGSDGSMKQSWTCKVFRWMVRVTPNYRALCSPIDKRAASGETCIGISFHGVVFGLQILFLSIMRNPLDRRF